MRGSKAKNAFSVAVMWIYEWDQILCWILFKKVTGTISVTSDTTKHKERSVTSVAGWAVEFPTEQLLFGRPVNRRSVRNVYKVRK